MKLFIMLEMLKIKMLILSLILFMAYTADLVYASSYTFEECNATEYTID